MDGPGYWDEIYRKKGEREVSWFQEVPARSLELIDELGVKPDDAVIDIGGGDSHLADALLGRGFRDVTILDISSVSLNKARARLGEKAQLIVSDVTTFSPPRQYRLWHDRATFHFLTKPEEIDAYLRAASAALAPGGFLIVSTFSRTGPGQCSGLPVSQYSDEDLKNVFRKYFSNIRCFDDTHTTPWGARQNFVYCGFRKK